MKRSLILRAVIAAAGLGLVVAGFGLWLGLAGALIVAGLPLVALGLMWESGS